MFDKDKFVFYTLDKDNNVIETNDHRELNGILSSDRKSVAKTFMLDGAVVSTVFLGLDHNMYRLVLDTNYDAIANGLFFETMVFDRQEGMFSLGQEVEGYFERYTTWEQALEGHKKIVSEYKNNHKNVVKNVYMYLRHIYHQLVRKYSKSELKTLNNYYATRKQQ